MTQQQPSTEETLAAAREALNCYGSDLSRWPEKARVAYGHLLEETALQDNLTDARIVDDLLAVSSAPATPHDLQNRILADYSPALVERPAGASLSGFSRFLDWTRLVPAGALAGFAAIGFAVGAVTNGANALSPEYEAYAYLEGGSVSDLVNEEGVLWDVD